MWLNPIITAILKSPLHWPASRRFLLLTVTGRKSGRAFTLPVFYRRAGNTLIFISHRDRLWWRNLCGGAPVTMLLGGRQCAGLGDVVDADLETLSATVRRLYWMLPRARAERLAREAVLLKVQLN